MSQKFKKQYFVVCVVILFLCISSSLVQAQMSSEEMLKMADKARGNLEGIQWDISMHSVERGREQDRKLLVIAKGYNSLIDTLAPGNLKGQKLLMQDRNMWFAKPGLSKPVPISPRQKLMGDASNGDIAATNYAADYKIVSTEDDKFNNEDCILLNLQAVDKRATYDRIKYWISKKRLVGLKAEFYTISGKMFKSAVFEYRYKITVDNKPQEFISKMTITNAIMKDDVTTVSYGRPVLKKVPDATFNLNLLTK
ncbi:MAG: outer membrane lipoprotein-sorting protein [Syntrophaceae bacterium]|nr:outer membrane lipoprotein-sorting protein [Syntrophaceae bacterium]